MSSKPFRYNHFLTLFVFLATVSIVSASDYKEPTTGMEFVLIKGGAFDMGDLRGNGYDIERPAHKVTVKSFYMGVNEVTFDQYDKFCEATKRVKPSDNKWGRGNQPVINVNWEDAHAFAAWLSQESGRKFRLPSEAEWEYAALSGRQTEFWWGDQIGQNNVNCADCGSKWDGQQPAPVGSFSANPFGLHDMHGNVYEWCQDTRHDDYEGAPTDGKAWIGGPTPNQHVVRSGSYLMPAFESRARARSWNQGQRSSREQGMRLVLEP